VTSPSRILIRLLATGEGGQKDQRNHHLNRLNIIETIIGIIIETIIGIIMEMIIRIIIETTSTSSAESLPQSSNNQRTIYWSPRQRVNDHPHERSVERVVATEPQTIRRASRHHRAANEPPPRYSKAIRSPSRLHRTNRRSAVPAPRIDDTPQQRVRRPWIGKETEGYV